MSEPEEITTMSGQKLPLKMSVDYISFSAHTDYQQTSEFIRALKPPHVVSLWIWFIALKEEKLYPLNLVAAGSQIIHRLLLMWHF